MSSLTLAAARTILSASMAEARARGLKPLSIAIVDAGGHLVAFEREDGASFLKPKVAFGKAHGAVAMGLGSRALFERAQAQPFFIQAVNALADGALVAVPGGVLIRAAGGGVVLGAVGISGDTSDADEAVAVAGILAAGLSADTGKEITG